ncbi:MAG: hypothetical protein KAQ96_00610, partial [Thermoplasmata archaeon]|nr:hypothetical protein [Thermoplasmata archaeon]
MAGDTVNEVEVAVTGNPTFLPRGTRSLCPVCRTVVDAILEDVDGRVVMSKTCPDHGHFETIISSNAAHYMDAARYERPGKEPLMRLSTSSRGCPHDCGLCEAHRQHTCVGVIEVTSVCDLGCNVCFADASDGEHVPLDTVKTMVDTLVECEGEVEVLQISG